jgi:DNA-binding YbaB/EbfC family protein
MTPAVFAMAGAIKAILATLRQLVMNLSKLMKQAQKMQEQMARTQAELESRTVEVNAGGGKVRVTANGAGDVIAIKIDPEVVDPNDVAFLEELVLSGVKQAVEQGKALAQSELAKITGGLNLPDLRT